MKRLAGQLAIMAAVGGGLIPEAGTPIGGHDQGDGTYHTRCVHPDGRQLLVITGRGDGWQAGPVRRIVRSGPWSQEIPPGDGRSFRHVRDWLNIHEPGREEPYCGGEPQRQARPLDGRERDILCRVLRDIQTAIREKRHDDLYRVLTWFDQAEVYRLAEVFAVIDPRDD